MSGTEHVVCPHCAGQDRPAAELFLESGLKEEDCKDWNFRVGRGCGACRGGASKGFPCFRAAIAACPPLP